MAEITPNGVPADVEMADTQATQQPDQQVNGTTEPIALAAELSSQTAAVVPPPAPIPAAVSPAPTRPSSQPPTSLAPPDKPAAHGSPTRVYINQNVTPHLLEGMKYLAAYEPEKPLKWLSEFLAKKSAEVEGQ